MAEAYQVIARRWRPRRFDQVVGQEHIIRTLRNAIETGRIAHAYLFVGPRGTGKTTTARLFAKCLNAEGGPSADPSDESALSQAIMRGECLDVIEIDGASNNSVEQVRQLREDCQYAPAQATFKIYIIDEVHMLSASAFNALLKTLEEPPPHVKFIFATTEAEKLLPTIVSRCQRFEFRPLQDEAITGKLAEIAEAEGIRIDAPALRAVARMANGGMRDAQSILDQLISFCGTAIGEPEVLDVYGLIGEAEIQGMLSAVVRGDYAALLERTDRLHHSGKDLYRVYRTLQDALSDALSDAARQGGETDRLGEPASTEALLRMLDGLQEMEGRVRTGLNERVNFELALLKAAEAGQSRAIDTVLRDLAELSGNSAASPPKKKAVGH